MKKKTERLVFFFSSLLPQVPDIRRVSTGYDKKRVTQLRFLGEKKEHPPLTHSLPPLGVLYSSEFLHLVA